VAECQAGEQQCRTRRFAGDGRCTDVILVATGTEGQIAPDGRDLLTTHMPS
jgi:hypothetical protein